MTKRFQQLLLDTFPARKPWEKLGAAQLLKVAQLLDDGDVLDIINVLESLSEEKDALDSWDGDTQDDIAAGQAVLADLLRELSSRYRDLIIARLEKVGSGTKLYLELALR